MGDAVGGRAFLGALTAEERDGLDQIGRRRSFHHGETLFHEGDPSRHVVVVLSGYVKVSSSSEGGIESLLAIRGVGEIVGELAAIDGALRSARVSAIGPLLVQVISAADFDRFLDRTPRVREVLLALLASRLRDADRKRVEARALDVPRRVAMRLLELVETCGRQTQNGVAVAIPLSQREIAEWVGASREAVARALHILRQRGAVDTGRRFIAVLRPDVLHRFVGSSSQESNE